MALSESPPLSKKSSSAARTGTSSTSLPDASHRLGDVIAGDRRERRLHRSIRHVRAERGPRPAQRARECPVSSSAAAESRVQDRSVQGASAAARTRINAFNSSISPAGASSRALTYATSVIVPSAPLGRATAATSRTNACPRSMASTPSRSTRDPRILTCLSLRPTRSSSPSGLWRARSPVRNIRASASATRFNALVRKTLPRPNVPTTRMGLRRRARRLRRAAWHDPLHRPTRDGCRAADSRSGMRASSRLHLSSTNHCIIGASVAA